MRKNYIIFGVVLLGLSLFLYNCALDDRTSDAHEKEDQVIHVNTVSFQEAIKSFNSKKSKNQMTSAKLNDDEFTITPDWNTLQHTDAAYTDADLTIANTLINRDGDYQSQLHFINVNNTIKNVIFTIYKDQVSTDGNVIEGRLFFNDLNGVFLDGYKIEDGVFAKRYVIQEEQQASFLPLFILQSLTTEGDCWNTDTLGEFDGGILDTVDLGTIDTGGGGSGSQSSGAGYSDSYNWYNSGGSDGFGANLGGYLNGAGGGNALPIGQGGSGLSTDKINSAAGAVLIAMPTDDLDDECDLDPEDLIYDLDNNCDLSPYEKCLKNGYTQEVCDCVNLGNLLEICNTDCAQLDALTDILPVKIRLNELRLASQNHEKGVRINKHPETGEYIPSPILENNNGSKHINIKIHLHTAAVAHTHPDEVFYKMFSAPDILRMAEIATIVQSSSASTVLPLEITHILVFNDNGAYKTYALRFDDVASLQTLQNIRNDKKAYRNFKKELKNDYESDFDYQNFVNETDIYKQQEHLFNLFEKYNLNISLYEANFDNSGFIDNWQKINKDTLEQEPCN